MPALVGTPRHGAEEPLDRALVMSGGGARGAYEAGLIGALAAAGAVADGSPRLPYELVCGTSIGALNVGIGKAYLVGWEDVGRGFIPYDWSTFQL